MRVCPRCHSAYASDAEFCGIDGEHLVEMASDPLVGRTIERYQILEPLGTGGMGRVYRAKHTELENELAIKVLFGEMAASKHVAERFRREAKAASKIRHPNIVSVLDFGTTPSGLTFLAMELLRGRTLGEAIAAGEPFPPARVADVARQIASGLSEAHAQGFVHRDLKPGNIMLVPSETGDVVKILDFGIVRQQGDTSVDTKLTQTGYVLGTPAYMAPEQMRQSEVGTAADLYALGVLIYEMIARRPPFKGTLADLMVQTMTERPSPLPESGGLEQLAYWLLEKEPDARPESARAVIAEIDKLDLRRGGVTLSSLPARGSQGPAVRAPSSWGPRQGRQSVDLSMPLEVSPSLPELNLSNLSGELARPKEPSKAGMGVIAIVAGLAAALVAYVLAPSAVSSLAGRKGAVAVETSSPVLAEASDPLPPPVPPEKTPVAAPTGATPAPATATVAANPPPHPPSAVAPPPVPAESPLPPKPAEIVPEKPDREKPRPRIAPRDPVALGNGYLLVGLSRGAEPLKVRVYVDGEFVGETPLRATVAAGLHQVELGEGESRILRAVKILPGEDERLLLQVE